MLWKTAPMLAPPWISVPAAGYGGVESVVSTLTDSPVRRGHDATLFCAPRIPLWAYIAAPWPRCAATAKDTSED